MARLYMSFHRWQLRRNLNRTKRRYRSFRSTDQRKFKYDLSLGFRLQYDANKLDYIDVSTGDLTTSFVAVSAKENAPGNLICAGFGTTSIPVSSDGTLMTLSFTANCSVGDSTEINILDLEDDLDGISACCNFFVCAPCEHDGDINSDNKLTPADALCAFETFLNGGLSLLNVIGQYLNVS